MAKSLIADGTIYNWAATAAKSAGDLIKWGPANRGMVGVASADCVTGDTVPVYLTGVHRLAKPTTIGIAFGTPVYWDGSALAATSTSNTYVGKAWESATAGANETTIYVLVNATPNRLDV